MQQKSPSNSSHCFYIKLWASSSQLGQNWFKTQEVFLLTSSELLKIEHDTQHVGIFLGIFLRFQHFFNIYVKNENPEFGKKLFGQVHASESEITQGVKSGSMESKGSFNWKDMFQIDEQLREIDFNSNRPIKF